MTKAYVYNVDTLEIVKTVEGNQSEIEEFLKWDIDSETHGYQYSTEGLVDTDNDPEEINLGGSDENEC